MPVQVGFVAVLMWDLTFSLVSRSRHSTGRQTALLLVYITGVTGSPQHGPGACWAMRWTWQNEDLFTVWFFFSHSALPASGEITTEIAKLSHYPHAVSSWKFSVARVLERNLTKDKPVVCWQYPHCANQCHLNVFSCSSDGLYHTSPFCAVTLSYLRHELSWLCVVQHKILVCTWVSSISICAVWINRFLDYVFNFWDLLDMSQKKKNKLLHGVLHRIYSNQYYIRLFTV